MSSLVNAQTTTTVTKSCGACNGPVSEYASVGQTCPHCGVTWGDETTTSTTTTLPASSYEFSSVPSSRLPTSSNVYFEDGEYKVRTSDWPSTSNFRNYSSRPYRETTDRTTSAVNFHNRYSNSIRRKFEVQLTKAGFFSGDVDGLFTASTIKAIRNFQRAMGLSVDGRIGPATMRYLNAY